MGGREAASSAKVCDDVSALPRRIGGNRMVVRVACPRAKAVWEQHCASRRGSDSPLVRVSQLGELEVP